ncbi:hypothetical protein [Hoeflea alexandrii]
MKRLAAAFLLAWLPAPAAHAAGCFDVSAGEPARLEGELSFRIFAGPPNFEDVQKGDSPEPGYVLTLPQPICLTGDADFTDPSYLFDEVQLVATEATAQAMREFRNRTVSVDLVNPMPAMTGHHHRPLVAWVSAIATAGNPTENYGSAATTVEAFYLALGAGDGATAAAFVIPEKTTKGPFSAAELTRFYGGLREPLELISMTAISTAEFLASYRFAAGDGICDGRALVRTENRDGRFFIRSIKALNGC